MCNIQLFTSPKNRLNSTKYLVHSLEYFSLTRKQSFFHNCKSITHSSFCHISFPESVWIQGNKCPSDARLDGKVVIVTGCNKGIGKETVLDLAARGAYIHMACRDYRKCERTRQEIIAKTGNKYIFNRELDLASFESIRKFVAK